MKSVTNFTSSSDLNPRHMRLDWLGEGEPQTLIQKVILKGSEDTKFLTICQPPTPIGHGMSEMIRNGASIIQQLLMYARVVLQFF